ncbi:hypothetical protein EUX98_g8333 [Antrodiella citrinella]|uniref:Protein kinase domain-containing protein n=1 Tax=Antrodiella citrinella TaxID=2447956 RepID=A0A4S4M8Y6_9APHY|nr:hypothetical protein EUX98_g8333 [Antrodiella citrinella]
MAETQMMELQDIEAQYAMNVMQKFQLTMAAQALESDHAYDDRDAIRRLMLKLSTRCEKLPTSLFLMGVKCSETECYSVGSFADIYIGEYEGRKVALKRLRMFQMIHESKKNRMTAAFYYESLIWKNLRHQHVLTFLGVADSLFTRGLCMVLPWMPFGHIRHALDDFRISSPLFDLTPQIQKWIHEISLGLGYLHDEHVVHGDLRGANILIDENRSVRLADFGLAVFAEATSQNYASTRGGNARWLAPELIYPEMFELKSVRPTYATDVFAFGCVVIELYSGQAPYAECSDHQVVARVPAGLRPKRPSPIEGVWISDAMWYLATVCWKSLPSRRPSTHTLIKTIEEIVNTTNRPAAVSRSSSRTSLRSIEEEQNRERERQWNKPSPNNMRRRSETTLRVRISQERLRVAQANTNTGTLVSSPGPLKTSISDSPQAPKSPVTQNERRSVSAFDLRRKDEGVYDAKYIRERNWNSPQPKWGASSSSRSSPGPSSPSPSSPTPPYSTVRSLTAPSSASRRAGKKRASISSITTQIRELPETLDGPEPAEAPFSH